MLSAIEQHKGIHCKSKEDNRNCKVENKQQNPFIPHENDNRFVKYDGRDLNTQSNPFHNISQGDCNISEEEIV